MKFVLTADWHVRGDRPLCRRDADWIETQRQAIRFIVNEANSRKCVLVILGDICNMPRISTPALVMLIEELRRCDAVLIEAGNHDLPYHSWDNVDSCSYGVLRQYFPELHAWTDAGTVHSWMDLDQCAAAPFGLDVSPGKYFTFTHQLVFPDEASRPGPAVGKTAAELANQFPEAGWIFTGDYHHSFDVTTLPAGGEDRDEIYECDKVRVVNPGCILRQAADMMDYAPKIAVVDTEAETVEWILVPDPGEIDGGVVTDSHLREQETRDKNVDAFVEALRTGGAVSLSFRDNLQRKLDDPEMTQPVRDVVLEVLNKINKEQ